MLYLCHLAPMPTCAFAPIPQSPHSTCPPVHTPPPNLPLPCLPLFFKKNSLTHLKSTLTPSEIPPPKHFTMAATTPSFTPFSFLATLLLLLLLLLLTNPTPSSSFSLELKVSGISAAPAFLPNEPPKISSIPPALAPDMMPFFPSPGGNAGAVPVGTLPTIPSSPSPPNPDELRPNSAITPSGSAAAVTSAASSTSLGNLGGVSMGLVCGLVLMWWLELVDW